MALLASVLVAGAHGALAYGTPLAADGATDAARAALLGFQYAFVAAAALGLAATAAALSIHDEDALAARAAAAPADTLQAEPA